MNRIHVYTTAAILIFAAFLQTSHSQEFRNFSNTSGKVIKAKIVSATAEEVNLVMENGRNITAGVQYFSPEDQAYIRAWAKKNPIVVNYQFDVSASRKRTDRDEVKESAIMATYETWVYNVKIENRSRTANHKGADLKGLSLHYNIVLTPKAQAKRASSLLKGTSGSGKHRVKKGKVSMGTLSYLDKMEYPTNNFPISKSELAPGYYYPNGGKDNREDDLEGIIIKILKGKDVIFEKAIGSKALENIRWAAP